MSQNYGKRENDDKESQKSDDKKDENPSNPPTTTEGEPDPGDVETPGKGKP